MQYTSTSQSCFSILAAWTLVACVGVHQQDVIQDPPKLSEGKPQVEKREPLGRPERFLQSVYADSDIPPPSVPPLDAIPGQRKPSSDLTKEIMPLHFVLMFNPEEEPYKDTQLFDIGHVQTIRGEIKFHSSYKQSYSFSVSKDELLGWNQTIQHNKGGWVLLYLDRTLSVPKDDVSTVIYVTSDLYLLGSTGPHTLTARRPGE